MPPSFQGRTLQKCLLALAFVTAFGRPLQSEPIKLRIGFGTIAEEQLWLLIMKPQLGKGQGKAYSIDATRFIDPEKRAQAFERGAIDLATSTADEAISAAARGVKMKVIGSLARESKRGFSTTFSALSESSIKTPQDLKGKQIGISALGSSGHLWLKTALDKAGLNDKDVTITPKPMNAMGSSLRARELDVGQFAQPFLSILESESRVTKIFTAKEAIPYEEEFVVLVAKESLLKENASAVKALLQDLREINKFYLDQRQTARKVLLDTKMVRLPADIFLKMDDYYRDPTMSVSLDAFEKIQDARVAAGIQTIKTEMKTVVDLTYLID